MHYSKNKTKKEGFTLIELLIVVSLVGVLAGVLIKVVDPDNQKHIAEDAVKKTNVQKISQAVEAFCAAEGSCPVSAAAPYGDPTAISGNENLANYLNGWPGADSLGNVYYYRYTGGYFAIWTPTTTYPTTRFFKYTSYYGNIKLCTAANITNVPTSAATAYCTCVHTDCN